MSRELSGFQPLPDRRGDRSGCKEGQVPTEERNGRRKERPADDMESPEKEDARSGADRAWPGATETDG